MSELVDKLEHPTKPHPPSLFLRELDGWVQTRSRLFFGLVEGCSGHSQKAEAGDEG